MTNLHSGLSPLIECPCTDRITRKLVESPVILNEGVCSAPILNEANCTTAISGIATVVSSKTITDNSKPRGCLVVPTSTAGEVMAVFNDVTANKATCDSRTRGPLSWTTVPGKSIDCGSKACLPPNAKYGCTGEFKGQCTWDSVEAAEAGCAGYAECQAFFCTTQYSDGKLLCFGRQVTGLGADSKSTAYVKTFEAPLALAGQADLGGLVNLSIAHNGSVATITMVGPDGVWFGVGFDAAEMADLPYAIIVDGKGSVSERKLASHAPGTQLASSITVVSSSVVDHVRTVVLTRAVAGATSNHYTIPTAAGEINMITAIGNSVELAYHAQRTGSKIVLLPSSETSCMCTPTSTGYFTYMNQSTSQFDGYFCADEPRSDMLRHGDGTGRNVSNAACHTMTYNGGLRCCAHHNFLTDLEQAPLIPNKTDTYYLKWRYYFQECVQ